jgi:hypothetical protein
MNTNLPVGYRFVVLSSDPQRASTNYHLSYGIESYDDHPVMANWKIMRYSTFNPDGSPNYFGKIPEYSVITYEVEYFIQAPIIFWPEVSSPGYMKYKYWGGISPAPDVGTNFIIVGILDPSWKKIFQSPYVGTTITVTSDYMADWQYRVVTFTPNITLTSGCRVYVKQV